MTNRRFTRRTLLAGAASALVATRLRGDDRTSDSSREALRAAVDWLWAQQADDGGWHSPQYGVMRSGQSLTPFVLHALLQTIDEMSSDQYGRVQQAGRFLLSRLDDEGVLGRFDPEVMEYPVYSTAYAVRCFRRMFVYREMLAAEAGDAIRRMVRYLNEAQFDEAAGFAPHDPAYGGWGFQAALAPGRSGHTGRAPPGGAVGALALPFPWIPTAGPRMAKAQAYLRVLQKHPEATAPHALPEGAVADEPVPFDGGFYFSPVVLDANKGGVDPEPTPHWRSYATATCDGVLALVAAGLRYDDERVTAAADWLARHDDFDYPEGVPRDDPEPWGEAIRFYHYAVRGEAYRRLAFPAADRARLAAAVARRQQSDGRFVNNAAPLMKEDCPVLCTALAVVALASVALAS